jgi:hypothetical protein
MDRSAPKAHGELRRGIFLVAAVITRRHAHVKTNSMRRTQLAQPGLSSPHELSRTYRARGGAPSAARVDERVFTFIYYQDCTGCTFCHDWCCSWGCDVDLGNVSRLESEGEALERHLGSPSRDWFLQECRTAESDAVGGWIHAHRDPVPLSALEALGVGRAPTANRHRGRRLRLIEHIMTPDNEISFAIDIVMLTLLGGKQRTRADFDALLQSCDWSAMKVIDTDSGYLLIEATVV